MDIEEAFRHALDGNAILFLGAGFSLGARNRRNEEFPLANDLARHLTIALGETETVQLQIASQLYVERHGEVGLLDFLNQHLGVREVAAHHRSFARPNWRRIYTTNYDEVLEVAARDEQRRIRPLILTPRIPSAEPNEIDCVHLNGFLPLAKVQNLDTTLILSETAYLTNRFVESSWAHLLRSDVEAARAVVFAGYSLADLDIGRILVAVERVRRKCVFIVKPDPGLALRTTIAKFGTVAPIGVKAAAQHLDRIAKTHKPAATHVEFTSFRSLQKATARVSSPTAQDIFNLLVKGEIDPGFLERSLSQAHPSYIVHRAEIDDAIAALERGASAVLVLSRLANGKSILSECVSTKIRDRFDVFIFSRATLSLRDELRILRTPSRPTLIVVDDYARHLDIVRELRLGAGPNQSLLLTSRTATHLTARDQLQGILGEHQAVEIRADTLRENELTALDTILAGAGLLGETAAWPGQRRVTELYQARGAGEFAGILLWLLESPVVRDKLVETFATLKGQKEPQRVIVAAMVLTHIGQPPDFDDIAEFIGADSINQAIFSESSAVAELVRFERRGAYPRSSLFAVAALRSLWNEGHVPEVLEDMLTTAWKLRSENKRFHGIARDLMRYSKIRQIVPTNDQSLHVRNYYDRIRNLAPCVTNELFWLQFGMADIHAKQFDVAERHLKQSYTLASRKKGFDTFQIDNVQAMFLLSREIEERRDDRAMWSFIEANKIVSRQLRDRKNAYYPYRVASLYGEFWRRIARHWSAQQRAVFIAGCNAVCDYSKKVDRDLAVMDDVARCRTTMEEVIAEAGAMAAH